jgi:hypothetical protein
MGVCELFAGPLTSILPISTSQAARITDTSHKCSALTPLFDDSKTKTVTSEDYAPPQYKSANSPTKKIPRWAFWSGYQGGKKQTVIGNKGDRDKVQSDP